MSTRLYLLWNSIDQIQSTSCKNFDPVESWESTIQEHPDVQQLAIYQQQQFSPQCFSLSLTP